MPFLHTTFLEGGLDWEDPITTFLLKVLFKAVISPSLTILDLLTTKIYPILAGNDLFDLSFNLLKKNGIFKFFLLLFFIFLPLVVSVFAVYAFISKKPSPKIRSLFQGFAKIIFFITLTPTLFFFFNRIIFLFSASLFHGVSNFSLADLIYRLGYDHDTSKTHHDLPPTNLGDYSWLVVLFSEVAAFLLVWKLFLPLLQNSLELLLLIVTSPIIGFFFFNNNKIFHRWKNDVFSRFSMVFCLQFFWALFLILFEKISTNPFHLELSVSHLFTGIFIFGTTYFVNKGINLLQQQLGFQPANTPTIITKTKSSFINKLNIFKRKRN